MLLINPLEVAPSGLKTAGCPTSGGLGDGWANKGVSLGESCHLSRGSLPTNRGQRQRECQNDATGLRWQKWMGALCHEEDLKKENKAKE
ncbi:hypothetical protein XELAEV_18008906mg [Xenopus laevis]|uniref:Uncharacterized protein n=1 Tax=Xenopus laevis TaxID=8355 RepID=A0A974I028_XENLA|nr:hypothetical protein XELAEV_18008906mg [Xenopus laevis]